MKSIALVLGILINLTRVCSSTGVIDISSAKSRELFSGPTKIGNAQFYKYTCKDNGSYSNVYDGSFKIFPLRSHTRLVNIVLACKDDQVELVQVMYYDVKKDLRLNNLYYSKSDNDWELIDLNTYKAELSKLKNNYVSFQVFNPEHKGFVKVKSSDEDGFDSYVLEEGYEIDKVYENKLVVWECAPDYTFKSIDISGDDQKEEKLGLRFSDYCTDVSQYYKVYGGKWVLDMGVRVVDLLSLSTHGIERSDQDYDDENRYLQPDYYKNHFDKDQIQFDDRLVTLTIPELCDSEADFDGFKFNLNFTREKFQQMTVRYNIVHEVSNYEFLKLKGATVRSIMDNHSVLFDSHDQKVQFYNAKISYVPGHHTMAFFVTVLDEVKDSCNPHTKKCEKPPYELKYFFHKKKGDAWVCLERRRYTSLLNELIQVGTQLKVKQMIESPPVTPTHTPPVAGLDYGGKEPFTYEINNPFENRIVQDIIYTEPDFIRLRIREGFVMNAILDGSSVLWEQTEEGMGVVMIYIYRSDDNLVGHLLVDSPTEPHIFIKQNKGRWVIIDQDQYERSKDVPLKPKKIGLFKKRIISQPIVDEYTFDMSKSIIETVGQPLEDEGEETEQPEEQEADTESPAASEPDDSSKSEEF